jgi:hypothetical protein
MKGSRVRRLLLVVAGVLLVGGFILGSTPVGSVADGESFHCGSAFFYDNSEGYRGFDGFRDCRETADSRLPLALTAMALGAGLLLVAASAHRRARLAADEPRSARA